MLLKYHSQGLSLTPEEQETMTAQINRTLNSFSDKIRSVDVYIKDINGPRGGRDNSVTIRARLNGKVELASSALKSKLLSASALAARKTRRRVKSALRRQRQFERFALGDSRPADVDIIQSILHSQ